MEEQNPTFNFPLEYGGNTVNCEVSMTPMGYNVVFDGTWTASLEQADGYTWTQSAGDTLPSQVVEEIGLKIESQYA